MIRETAAHGKPDKTDKILLKIKIALFLLLFTWIGPTASREDAGREHRPKRHRQSSTEDKLSLWIPNEQVKMFSGFPMEIQAISEGHVLPYILDPNFQDYLPVIPSDVGVVNFTWKAGRRKYFYNFDSLRSLNPEILEDPIVSMPSKGRIPRRAKSFSVNLPCSGKKSGIAAFSIGLVIETRNRQPLTGTPLRLRLRKECKENSPDPECDLKCGANGRCNFNGLCVCKEGYHGLNCTTALCFPQCLNGGICIAPGKCSCQLGFHGSDCESGICTERCLNGGKCLSKDTCECASGYYGKNCQFSKCMIPCLNGGRCRGVNVCRCQHNFSGDHCEIGLGTRTMSQRHSCALPCRNGNCVGPNKCECFDGWYGKRCQRRKFLR